MLSIIKKILPTLILIFLSPVFFYKLGQSSLVSFDEAWYADIARNIIKSGDLFNLKWNGSTYDDHPGGGFWLIAVSFKLFGVNEFSARFAQALSGWGSLFITYLLGKRLFNGLVGLFSALALTSAPWFVLRARSGNLDSILVFFFLTTIYLFIKSIDCRRFFAPFLLSYLYLFLIKTAIPLTIIPVMIFILITDRKKLGRRYLLIGLFFLIVIPLSLYSIILLRNHNFVSNFIKIGLPGVSVSNNYLSNLKLMKDYLYFSIGRWFWPTVLSTLLGIVLFGYKFVILGIFTYSFFLPFLLSAKGHVWQLIPLHPFMMISLFGFMFLFIEKYTKKITAGFKYLNKIGSHKIASLSIFCVWLIFWYPAYIKNWREFIDIPAFVSDEAILSVKAAQLGNKLYIDEAFLPAAVFYFQGEVKWIQNEELRYLFDDDEYFLLITKDWRLDGYNISKTDYNIIMSDRDKILIERSV